MTKTNFLYLISSILLHIVLGFFLFCKFLQTDNGNRYLKSLPAFLCNPSSLNLKRSPFSSTANLPKPSPTPKKINTGTKKFSSRRSAFQDQSKSQPHYQSENEIDNALLTLLHKAIAEHSVYPTSAMELHQEGVVQVGFLLSESGLVSNIKLLKSSGFEILDEAALEAMRRISPILNISQYLHHSALLSVSIEFKTEE